MKFWSALAALMLAMPVSAEPWQCRLDVECFDQEACGSTDYELTLGPVGDRYLMSDIAGERPMVEIDVLDTADMRAFASLVQNASVHLLSIYPGGTAHLSVQAAGDPPFMVTYRGRCEVEP